MIGRTLSAFALSLTLASQAGAVATAPKKRPPAPIPDDAAAFDPIPKTEALLRQAKDLWLIQEDFSGALGKFNEAVSIDPEDNDARLARAHFFEVLSQIVIPGDQPKFAARAREDFERIVETDPESLIAGVARDGLTRLSGEPLIANRVVACPTAAAEAHARANALYGARRYDDAIVEYARATSGCPENSSWWVELADSFYETEDYDRAKSYFAKALSVDRWNREAHRYLADTHVQLGDNEGGLRELVLAVVSDPTYEAGWSALRAYGGAMGRKWNRVYGDRKLVAGNPDGAAWKAYESARTHARATLGKAAPALAVEREAVKAALKAQASGPFWSMLARADRDGFLDEAIFLHLLDASLAAEYPAFREANAARLADYLETVILR